MSMHIMPEQSTARQQPQSSAHRGPFVTPPAAGAVPGLRLAHVKPWMRFFHSLLVLALMCMAAFVVPAADFAMADTSSSSSSTQSASSSDSASTSTIYTEATDADSWTQIAGRVSDQLDEAVSDYTNGDKAGARSAAQRANNQVYAASNLANAISVTDPDAYAQQSAAFTTFTQLTLKDGAGSDLAAQRDALEASINASAAALDADSSVSDPRTYASQRTAQIQSERRSLDANKKRVNEGRGDRTWSDVAAEMTDILDQAIAKTQTGDGRAGSDLVNTAYYQYYEKLGFEKTVMNAISGARVSLVENQFKTCRKDMVGTTGASLTQTEQDVEQLKSMLTEDAGILDGGAASNVNPVKKFFNSSFGQAFLILLREGLEAILVVAAIIAYLIKTGNKPAVKFIYLGILLGLVTSGIMAVVLNIVYGASGANQELVEGWTALAAMLMLLFTGNWMLSKSSVESWNRYVHTKTEASVAAGSVLSLALLSFLAVFREGAETVLFYQALLGMAAGSESQIWHGAIAAAVVLVIVFLLIRFTSVKIPIGPFFFITSLFMALMVVVFAGGGLHELIEADVFDGTFMPTWPTNDFLGIYPYVQTVAFQAVMLVIVVVLFTVSTIKRRREEAARRTAESAQPAKGTEQIADESAEPAKESEQPAEESAQPAKNPEAADSALR